jgi:biotin transporter BioY
MVGITSAGPAHLAAAQKAPEAVAEIRPVPTPFEALKVWAYTVVLVSLFSLLGPLSIPWLHTGHFNQETSFGKGELLGFAFALFAAALSRWIVQESDRNRNIGLMFFSIAGMLCVSFVIGLLWFDAYQVQINQTKTLLVQLPQIMQVSWGLVFASVLCGAATEFSYARSLRETAVKVVP